MLDDGDSVVGGTNAGVQDEMTKEVDTGSSDETRDLSVESYNL